jgi:hypothetical protein
VWECWSTAPSPKSIRPGGLGMLKGRKIFLIDGRFGEPRFYRHLRGGTFFYHNLGLKPQAESYHPFGIESHKHEGRGRFRPITGLKGC